MSWRGISFSVSFRMSPLPDLAKVALHKTSTMCWKAKWAWSTNKEKERWKSGRPPSLILHCQKLRTFLGTTVFWLLVAMNCLPEEPHNKRQSMGWIPFNVTLDKVGTIGLNESYSISYIDLPTSNGGVHCLWKQPVQMVFIWTWWKLRLFFEI